VRVRWTADAADDLVDIIEFIRRDNPAAARRMAQTIYKGIAGLIFGSYIAVYEIIDNQVQVLRIRHAAQDWP